MNNTVGDRFRHDCLQIIQLVHRRIKPGNERRYDYTRERFVLRACSELHVHEVTSLTICHNATSKSESAVLSSSYRGMILNRPDISNSRFTGAVASHTTIFPPLLWISLYLPRITPRPELS